MKVTTKHLIILGSLFAYGCTEAPKKFTGKLRGADSNTSEATPGTEDATGDDDGASDKEKEEKEKIALTDHEVLHGFPTGADQMKILCSRPGGDRVKTAFCGATPPTITNLVELQRALGLGIQSANSGPLQNGNPGFVFTGHSSSLVAKFVNAINPRLVMFSDPTVATNYIAMGFARGEQFAEIAAHDPTTNRLKFFLAAFEQACNAKEGGCTNGDLLSPAVETGWTKFTIYEDVDLKNTIVDCLMCHQPNGPNAQAILRMQEQRNPWNHWFRNNRAGGQALIADYQLAHPASETYAGVPGAIIPQSDPADLEDLIQVVGHRNLQTAEFLSANIEPEVNQTAGQPQNNTTPGTSAAWQQIYDQHVAGNTIAPPYHDIKVTDPAKLPVAIKSYQDYLSGAATTMMDIRDIFHPQGLRDMGFMVKAGLDGQGILLNACKQCHNDNLDQNISRARFNVDLSKMSREAKDKAIQRIMLPNENLLAMPPRRFKILTDEEKALLVELLKQ